MTDNQTLSELFLEIDLEAKEAAAARLATEREARARLRNAYLSEHPEYDGMIDQLTLFEVRDLDDVDEEMMESDYDSKRNDKEAEVAEHANIVGSTLTRHQPDEEQHHLLLLDLDHSAMLLDSSTRGHHHLYVDVEIPDKEWRDLIKALAAAGVIEESYAEASLDRGHTDLRPPWIKKP